MEHASTSWNLFANPRDQHHESLPSSRPNTAYRNPTLRKEDLRADTEQGRVPPLLSDGIPHLTRSAAQPSTLPQEGLRLWHDNRRHPVPPGINTQPHPRPIHQQHQPLHRYHHQHQQHQHQYKHPRHISPRHSISASDKPHLYPNINSYIIDNTGNTFPYLPLPFSLSLPPSKPRPPLNIPFQNTTKAMDSRQDTAQSPPTPLSSPRESSRPAGGRGTPAPASDSVAAFFAHFPARSALVLAQSAQANPAEHATQPPEPADFYAYCLDRGNGMYTRLVPADLLPMMTNVPPLLTSSYGMRVLPEPPLQSQQPIMPLHLARLGSHFSSVPNSFSISNIPPQASSSSTSHAHSMSSGQRPGKKNKVYCSKWVHDGTCAFTQQGCKYKHEMPHDTKTQRDLGLFQGYPAWYKKWQQEQAQQQVQQLHQMQQIQEHTSSAESFSPITPSLLAPPPPPSAQGQPATPLAMRTHIPSGQQDLGFGGQCTPPFSAGRTVAGSLLGGNTSQTTQTAAAAWPPVDQLADSFGRNLGFSETPTSVHAQQFQQAQYIQSAQTTQNAQNAHNLAQQQQRHLRQPSCANSNGDPASSLFPTSASPFYRAPNANSSMYFAQGPSQATLSSPPPRNTRSRAAASAMDSSSSAFGPIGPPAAMAGFVSPSTFDTVYGQASRPRADQSQGNSFASFSHDSSN